MRILIFSPMSSLTKNVLRDMLNGCWAGGRRIGGASAPPFGLIQVATVLREDSPDNVVHFSDAQAEQLDLADYVAKAESYDVVILMTSTMSLVEDAACLAQFKVKNPAIRTIVFGSHPTFMPESTLAQNGMDICVRFEAEFVARDLVRAMRAGGEAWQAVPGIAFKRPDGSIQKNAEVPFYDMNLLPLPDVSLLPNVEYFNPLVRRLPYITTTTSKGCPGRCTFCTAPAFDGMKVRFKSAEYLKREITHYLEHGYREIFFRDETFFVDKRRDREVCEWIIAQKLDVSWLCSTRVATVRADRELLALAKAAGCHTIQIGVESGDQEILDGIQKGYTLDEGVRVFGWLRELGINSHAHVMIGNPGETHATVAKTIDYVLKLKPSTATFGICTPYPGTPLFAQVAAICPELRDGTGSDFSKLSISAQYNPYFTNLKKEELEHYLRLAYRRFYIRPSYFLDRLPEMTDLHNVRRLARAAVNVLTFSAVGN